MALRIAARRIRHSKENIFYSTFLLLSFILLIYSYTHVARANSQPIEWVATSQPSTLVSKQPSDGNQAYFTQECLYENVTIQRDALTTEQKNLCVVAGENVRIAREYPWSYPYVSFNSDSKFYYLDLHPSYYSLYLTPGGKRAIVGYNGNTEGSTIKVYDQFARQLDKVAGVPQYRFNTTNHSYPEEDNTITAFGWGVSSNGRYFTYGKNVGPYYNSSDRFIRINLETGERIFFGSSHYTYRYSPPPMPSFAVSNDGATIAAGGNERIKIWNIDQCGIAELSDVLDGFDPCPNKIYETTAYDEVSDYYASIRNLQFTDDTSELSFYYTNTSTHLVTLRAPGYEPPRLEYLALGDSYSSGEGDVDRRSDGSTYYTPLTNYVGGCHISERSYPFLLRDYYKINSSAMGSVACSGAQLVFDYNSLATSYQGQGGRLTALSEKEKQTQQSEAIEQLIPGKVPQIEFVRKYQPKEVTFTGGGNDVGFSDILKYCASPAWEGVFIDDTCGYAVEGSGLKSLLYSSIDTQYAYTVSFIKRILQVSPHTHVSVIGYPSFIASQSVLGCGLNGGFLNTDERIMINQAVSYMNSMLQKVAYDTGSTYVDIENSLIGGRLCEGGEYVTGLHDLGIDKISRGHMDESFHPNTTGHQKIAQTIYNSNVFGAPLQAESGAYDKQAGSFLSQLKNIIRNGIVVLTKPNVSLSVEPYALKPSSAVSATIYSEPTELGMFTAAVDGSFDVNFDMSGIPIGRHLLVVAGRSYSDEPVKYYQFIEVRASELDADGDGIPDSEDKCNYFNEWYDERSGADVCVSNDRNDRPKKHSRDEYYNGKEGENEYAVAYTNIGSTENLQGNKSEQVFDSTQASVAAIDRYSTDYRKNAATVIAIILITGGIYVVIPSKKHS